MENLKIVAAQINPLVGDIDGNTKKVIASALKARDELHADLVVFPEMVLTGYPPEDLLLRASLYKRLTAALNTIKQQVKDIYIIVGSPEKIGAKRYNSAFLIYNGSIIAKYHKCQLPNYSVFDEKRYFSPGHTPCVFTLKGVKIAITVCEDLWFPDQMHDAKEAGAQLVISINASPFEMYKESMREAVLRKRAEEGGIPIIYVNIVGGQDELVFDGGSMVMDDQGELTQRAEFFIETLMPITIQTGKKARPVPQQISEIKSVEEQIYKALVLSTRDYIIKNHFKGALVCISGGIDSSLVLAIAIDAIGKDNVTALYMPSRYTNDISTQIVHQLQKLTGIKLFDISIEPMFTAFLDNLLPIFPDLSHSVAAENLQARCRAAIAMTFSKIHQLLLLAASNKSESSVGYATLYGDTAGGFSVLKDVSKIMVYRLSNYRNSITKIIPQEAIDRPPSAELAPDQRDTDSLPPYSTLDAILERYIELEEPKEEIIAAGFDKKIVEQIIGLVNRNEYKRRQSPPGIRVSPRSFGRDRRYPITAAISIDEY